MRDANRRAGIWQDYTCFMSHDLDSTLKGQPKCHGAWLILKVLRCFIHVFHWTWMSILLRYKHVACTMEVKGSGTSLTAFTICIDRFLPLSTNFALGQISIYTHSFINIRQQLFRLTYPHTQTDGQTQSISRSQRQRLIIVIFNNSIAFVQNMHCYIRYSAKGNMGFNTE